MSQVCGGHYGVSPEPGPAAAMCHGLPSSGTVTPHGEGGWEHCPAVCREEGHMDLVDGQKSLPGLLSQTGETEVCLSLITGGNEYFHDAENLMNMQMAL